ncbi:MULTISPECIES: hypothetical protein [unclassified Streptomyces]|uniref:hypothetical protein n=1 Tax=unclassified Streptomyces TaxID=2593676 RepID=UPI00117E2D93|nr:hypothetical protein [Streptomyces sp. rh34]
MNFWDEVDEQSAIRLLAVWVLLERSEQALSKSPRTPEDSEQAEGGQLAGWPPAPAPRPDTPENNQAKRELIVLLVREYKKNATAPETRRIAELLEYLDRPEEAFPWWERAAGRGDEDAKDYLEILRAEMQEKGKHPAGLSESLQRDGESASSFVWRACSKSPGSDAITAVRVALNAASSTDVSEEAKNLVRDIEMYMRHPDRMTDGRRR